MKFSNVNHSSSLQVSGWLVYLFVFSFEVACGIMGYGLGMNRIQLLLPLQHGPPKLVIVIHHPAWCRGRGLNVEGEGQGSSPKVTPYLWCGIGQASVTSCVSSVKWESQDLKGVHVSKSALWMIGPSANAHANPLGGYLQVSGKGPVSGFLKANGL